MKTPFLALILAASAAALPADARWYAGFSLGESRTDSELVGDRESTVTLARDFNSEFDSRDGAWKAMVGYRFHPRIAVEIDYTDLGKRSLRTNYLGGDPPLPARIDLVHEIRGIGADLVVYVPIAPQWSFFGRGGAMRAKLDARQSLAGNVVFIGGDPSERERSATHDETVARYGVGVQWDFATRATLRLEWLRHEEIGKSFKDSGSGATGEADTDAIFVGVLYRF